MNPMLIKAKEAIAFILLLALFMSGCKSSKEVSSNQAIQANGTNTEATKTPTPPVEPNEDGTISSGTGVEKEKPEAGKGNVQ
jgi:PBP1b-binding outer membrane lipoprotein LpoB